MRLWFSRASEISIRDQLVTQVVLSILSGELPSGQRLPSTRELARRFHLHPNTVSAGYRQLEQGNWVESRKGSGIYVREQTPETSRPELALEQLIARFFRDARKLKTPLAVIRSRLRHWLELQPPDHFLLIEPDKELSRILAAELSAVVTLPIKQCVPEHCNTRAPFASAIPIALSRTAKIVRDLLPDHAELLILHLRSAGDSLAPYLPAPSTALIGIASRWQTFLKTARTMLIAAGFSPDCLVLRDASRPNWRRGLKQASVVISDSLTATNLKGISRVLIFPLLAESSLKELQDYEKFIRTPLAT
jgi:GntR family transcriptional regulator